MNKLYADIQIWYMDNSWLFDVAYLVLLIMLLHENFIFLQSLIL